MPAVVYPADLPLPQAPLRLVPRERRALPPDGGAFNPRNRQRDFAGGVYEASWIYSPEEMALWRAWYQDDLLYGHRWFAAQLPLNGGIATRVVRYIGEQRREHLSKGVYRVTAQLEVRGASEEPEEIVTVDPVLHMHWDGNFADETGITVFTPLGSYDFTAADDPAFGQSVVGISNGRAYGVSSRSLAIGSQLYTIEGRSRFVDGQLGGVVLAKNYYSAPPALGVFKDDFSLSVTPTNLSFTWTDQVGGSIGASFGPLLDDTFTWSISDNGTTAYVHINGVLVGTQPAAALNAVPPPVSAGSSISVLNKLQGFSGAAPDWSNTFYVGELDELRMFIGYALYGADDYTPASGPF